MEHRQFGIFPQVRIEWLPSIKFHLVMWVWCAWSIHMAAIADKLLYYAFYFCCSCIYACVLYTCTVYSVCTLAISRTMTKYTNEMTLSKWEYAHTHTHTHKFVGGVQQYDADGMYNLCTQARTPPMRGIYNTSNIYTPYAIATYLN